MIFILAKKKKMFVHHTIVFTKFKIKFNVYFSKERKNKRPCGTSGWQFQHIGDIPDTWTSEIIWIFPRSWEELLWGNDFPGGTVVNNPSASAEDSGDLSSIPRLGRSPGEGNGNPLQYSCLGNHTDRGAWWASPWGHRVGHNWTHKQKKKRKLWGDTTEAGNLEPAIPSQTELPIKDLTAPRDEHTDMLIQHLACLQPRRRLC